ncbi:MAG: BRO family protein [Bifidobacterium breve]|jgi:prophage antirepressor-like protein|nr:BRO family protein [Bifidobacterium breve]
MSNALQTLRFEDTEVTALDCNTDEPVFVASPIAKKLAYESAKDMLRNLDSDEKGKHIVPTLGGEQEMSVITLPGLIHALNNRRPGAVKDEATRNMVIRFQRWVNHELVPTVMRTGRYEVQRPQHLLEAAHHERMMQVELLKASQGIVHPDFLEAKTRIVIARELGELPELGPKTRPLYTQDYLREKNLSAKQLRSKSGTFGKKLKAAYRERNGRDPQRADLTLPNGHIIQVYAYTEEDRPLFDRAWDELSQKNGCVMAGALPEKNLRLSLTHPIVSDSYRHSFPMELVCDPNDEADLFLTVFKAKVPMFDLWFDLTYSTFDGVTGSFYPDWSEWTFGDLKEAKDVLHSYLDSIDVLRVFFADYLRVFEWASTVDWRGLLAKKRGESCPSR